MTTSAHNAHAAYRPWSVRTVVVRLSRKLSATYRIRSGRRLSHLLAVLLAAVSPWAAALPEGAQVVAGQAIVSTPSTNAMLVNQASDKAVLNWQSFNIGAGQSMQFVQPGAGSVALNRVIGNGASSIFGSLSANGQVFLINPSGVMFAPGAQVNVGGLVASSLDIANGDFMAGRYSFSGTGAGAVSNHGSINAARGGYVLLAAPQVTNTGAITAEAGSVGLLAGSRVSVDTSGVGLVRFSVDAAAAQAVIDNSGSITATGGQVAVLASAMGDAMATVINQSGVIRANSAVERNGTIVLSGGATGIVNVSGELSAAGTAPGQTGGTVRVLGDKVALTGAALIDVSGEAGGGTALVGGDYQGLNAAVQNASRAYIGAGASIKADALGSGNGGKVIVWADDVTQFHGSITAKGGTQGGDGGFVETSGKAVLQALGSVDASAPNGAAGQWLLDPNNITIQTAGPDTNVSATPNFASTNDSAIVTTASIQAALNGGTSVNVTTSSAGTNSQAGDITVANAVAKTAGGAATLTLNASNNITFGAGANVTSSLGALGLTLNAAGAINSLGNVSLNGGTLNLNATGNVTQAGLIQGTTAVVKNGAGTLSLSNANTYSGGTTIKAGTASGTVAAAFGTGAITLGDSSGSANTTLSGGAAHANAINVAAGNTGVASITAGAASTFSGAVTLNNHDLRLAPVAGNLTMTGAVAGTGNLALNTTGAGTITLSGAGAVNNTGTVTNSGTGTGAAVISKVIGTNVAGVVENSATSQLTLSGVNTYTSGTVIKAGTVSGTVAAAFGTGAITLGDSSGSANATLNGGGAVTHANAINVAAGNTGVASITSSANSAFSGAVTLNSHDLRVAPVANTLALSGGVTGTGNLALNTTGAGAITLSGASAVNNSGTISNTGTGGGAATISAAVGSNVTAITENSATSALTISGALTVNGAGTVLTNSNASGAALLTVTGAVSGTGNLALNNNSAIANGITLSGAGTLNNTGTVSNNGTGTGATAISKIISTNVAGVVQNSATSQLTLSGVNTYTSGTTVRAGTLSGTTSAAAFGTGAITLGDSSGSANTTLNGGFAGTHANAINVAAGNTGVASITSSANSIFNGAVALNSHDLRLAPAASTLTLSGGVTGSGNLILNSTGAGVVTLSTAGVNNTGTISNTGTGAATNVISAAIGSNVTAITENSATSALTVSGALTVNSGGTTLTKSNTAGALLVVSGGVNGTGNLVLNNNSTTANGVTLSGAAVNNTGTITNSGTGTGAALISAAVGSNVTAITENSATSALTISGALTVSGAGTTLTNSNAGGAALLTVTGAVSGTGNLVLNNNSVIANGVTLSGAAILNNTGTVTNSGTGTGATLVSKVISTGVTGVVQNSATSQLTLSGVNTYSTGTTIKAGTVSGTTNASAFGTGAVTIGDGSGSANATLNAGFAGTYANAINVAAGNTGVAGIASGVNSTFTGAVTLNSHDLVIAASANTLTLSGGVTGTGNLSLNNNGATAGGVTLSGAAAVNNTGSITNSGTGTGAAVISKVIGTNVTGVVQNSATSQLTLSGVNTYSGGTTVKAGTLSGTTSAAAFGTGAITLGDISGSANTTLNGGFAGTHANAINVAAGNTGVVSITSSANSTFSGAVALNSHDLRLAPAASTLALSGGVTGTGNLALNTTGVGTITLSGAGPVNNSGTISNTGTGSGATTISAAVGANVTAITENSATSALTVSGALTVNGAGTVLTNSNASGAALLTVTGAVSGTGNLALNNNSAIANGITLSGAGTLNNTGTVSNNGTGTGGTAISKIISTNVAGVVQNSATSQLTLSGVNTYTSGTTVKAGTLSGTASAAAFGTGAITLGDSSGSANTTLNGGFAGTHANAINVAAGNTGVASITSSANSIFNGAVALNSHDLRLAPAASTLTLSGAVTGTGNLALNTTGAGTITLSGGAANNIGTITNSGTGTGGSTISKVIGANVTGVVENSVTSQLTLSGANTYTSGTTIKAGTVSGANAAAFGTGAITLGDSSGSANTTLSGGVVATLANAINVAAGNTGVASITSSAASTFSGAVTLNNHDLLVAPAASNLTLTGAVTGTGNLALNTTGAGTLTLSGAGAVNNTGTVTNSGTGAGGSTISKVIGTNVTGVAQNSATSQLTLSGVNTYTGATAVNAGTLRLGVANAIGAASAVNVLAGATFNLNGFSDTVASVSSAGVVAFGTGNTLTTSGAQTYTGQVTGNNATLASNGGGAITADNVANNFAGNLSVSTSGAASVVNAGALALGTVTASSLTARALAGNLTLNGNITASGSGDAIVLTTSGNFTNNAGAGALSTPSGRWLVYSSTPALDSKGGLTAAFKQYNATYGSALLGTGNGFVHSVAPTISAGLTGAVTKVYDGTTNATLAAGNYTSSGAIDGDVIVLNNPAAGSYDNKNAGTGKMVSVSGVTATATNGATTVYGYQVSGGGTVTGNIGTVTQRALTVSATGSNKVYDGNTTAGVTLADNRVGGDVLTASNTTASFVDKNAGIGKAVSVSGIALTGTDAGNYTVNTTAATTADITQRALTVSATGTNKVYDGGTSAGVTLTDNRVAGDVLTTSNTSASFGDKNVGTAKSVSVSGIAVTGTDAGNYTFNTTAAATADITQRTLTVGAAAQNKVYDGGTAATVTLNDNRVAGDVLATSNTAASFVDKNAGTGKAVNVSGIGVTGTDAGNYTFNTTAAATADITQRALTVSATGSNKVYDGTTTAGVTLADNRVGGDVLTASNTTASFVDKNAGIGKAVSVSGIALTGTDAGNYTVNTTAATTADITQRALTVSATGTNKVYDGGTSAGVTLTDNRVAGDVLTAGNTAASFGDKNVGNGKAVSVSGIAVTGTDAGNYTFNTTAATTADITQRALTVGAAAQNKVYDGGTAATVTLNDNRVAGDVLAASNTSANFADRNAGTAKTVNVGGIAITGTDAANYSVNSTAITTANITPASIANVSGITAADKMQDGTTAATLATGGAAFAGRLGADVLTVGAATGNFDTPAVGSGKPVSITGITLSGADAGNYVLLNTTAATHANVTAAPANMAERTGDGRIANGTALPVLDADDLRESAFRRAAGILRAQTQPGTADTPPFTLAGFPEVSSAAVPAAGNCTAGGSVSCQADVLQASQGQ